MDGPSSQLQDETAGKWTAEIGRYPAAELGSRSSTEYEPESIAGAEKNRHFKGVVYLDDRDVSIGYGKIFKKPERPFCQPCGSNDLPWIGRIAWRTPKGDGS